MDELEEPTRPATATSARTGLDGALVFTHRETGRSSRRLADLVTNASALDVGTLAACSAWQPPAVTGGTPYESVTCRVDRPEDGETTMALAPGGRPEDAASFLRAALRRAVEKATAGCRRVAVMAGGGLDSAGLLALAVDCMRERGGTAFAVAEDFEGPGDDRPHLRALEAKLGCEVVRVRPEQAAHRLEALLAGVDAAPICWPTAAANVESMVRARENGAECVLMGVGGDELFDGNPRVAADLAREGRLREAIALARGLRGFERPRSPVMTWLLRPIVSSMMPRGLRVLNASRRPLETLEWAGPALRELAFSDRLRALAEIRSEGAPRRFADPSGASYRTHLAWSRHAMHVASGIHRRDPWLDAALIGAVAKLPQELLLHGAVRRGLFREAMRGLLPESLRLRDDKAFFEPALCRMLAAAGGFGRLRSLREGRHLAAHGIVDPGGFAAAFDAFEANPGNGRFWTTVWPALSVEAFLRARSGERAS